jgi:hypothetical protein
MKIIIPILILLRLSATGYSQIIKGTVMDQNTHTGVNFASVYFSGTFEGTHTDQKGYFELDISQHNSMPLTISALGYYSIILSKVPNNKPCLIYLTPKVYELSEVVITAKTSTLKRRANLNIFKREFLGSTLNGMSCYISNEDDILFTYNAKSDTLKAFSSNPITIYNKALGYKIIYYLDKFEYCRSKNYGLITGNYLFSEDTTSLNNQQAKFERKRKSAFLGSRMHFFRALWENNLDQAGFVVKDSANVKLTSDKFVTHKDSLNESNTSKYIRYRGTLFVAYHSVLPQTQIKMIGDYVYFGENGFFDPMSIGWQGEMAKQRIGDLLPFEYKLK